MRRSRETEQTFAALARYRDGLMTEYTDFGDVDQALAAAGLSEWALTVTARLLVTGRPLAACWMEE